MVDASRPLSFSSEASGVCGDDVHDRVDPVGMGFPYCCRDVRVPIDELRDAEPAQVVLVLGKRRGDHVRARLSGELDEEAADASGGPDDEDGLSFGGRQRVEGSDRADRRERRAFRDGDELCPASVVHGRVGVEGEAKNLVAGAVAADSDADPLDDSGEVAAEGNGEYMLDHVLQRTRCDENVHRVDG